MSSSKRNIIIVGTLDTKHEEMNFIKNFIKEKGHEPIIIDAGIVGKVPFKPEIDRDNVALAVGMSLKDLFRPNHEGEAIALMAKGCAIIVNDLLKKGIVDAIISVGGTMGTSLGLAVMKDLPIGLPKLMVSTIAFTPLVTSDLVAKDQIMIQAPVDLWGLNVIIKNTLQNAASAIVGMAETAAKIIPKKPLIALTTRGNLKYANWIKPALESRGYEVVVIHCNGLGGTTLESLIRQGIFCAVLDFCTGGILEELTGGTLKEGSTRLDAAGDMGIPQVIAPGSMILTHWPASSKEIPSWRKPHYHNPLILCIKASIKEMNEAAEVMAEKLNNAKGPVTVLYPWEGFDNYDKKDGGIYYDPDGHASFFKVLKSKLKPSIEIVELNMHINDQAFAEYVIENFDKLIKNKD